MYELYMNGKTAIDTILNQLRYEKYIIGSNSTYIWYEKAIINNTYLSIVPKDILNIIKKYTHIVHDDIKINKCILCNDTNRLQCYHSIRDLYDLICVFSCNHWMVNRIIPPGIYSECNIECKYITKCNYNGVVIPVNDYFLVLDTCHECANNVYYNAEILNIITRRECQRHQKMN